MTSHLFAEIIVKSSLLLLLGLFVRKAIGRGNPTIRHLVLLISMVACMIIPFCSQFVTFRTDIGLPTTLYSFEPTSGPSIASSTIAPSGNSLPTKVQRSQSPISKILMCIWIFGLLVVTLRYISGLYALALIRREKSNIVACPLELDGPKHELRRSSNSAPSSALTWGVINPIILLPRDSLTWHAKQMEMILIHEFAHLRRKDFASQLVSELVCAIYWFNPLVWLSARAMRDDAELAADEAVIRAGHRPSDYATELLHVAAKLSMNHQTLNRVGISNMKHPKIESRLQAVLSSTGTNRGITMVSILAALAVSGIAVTGIASLKLRQSDSKQDQQALALKRLKDLAFSTLVYAADYDEVLPSGKSTAQVEEVMLPYVRSKDMYKSPRKGAELKFNLKVAGMALKAIKKPATIQLWYESAPAGMDPIASFVDGHAKVLMSKNVPPQGENLNNLNPPILVQDKSGNWVVSGGK